MLSIRQGADTVTSSDSHASQDSFIVDYCARQKLGGTSFSYFILKQLPVLAPSAYASKFLTGTLLDFIAPGSWNWFTPRMTSRLWRETAAIDGPPFRWDEARRFQIRAELDAAYLYAYLGPSDAWQPTPTRPRENLASLRAHFTTPKDAAAHILNSFPIVRDKDEKAHGHYRTRDTILALYEAFTAAHRDQRPWSSPLTPPPGRG